MTKTYGNFTDFIDFSRASSGTYLGSDGLLKTAADNVPRIEYDSNGNGIGLLIEEQRTNFIDASDASALGVVRATTTAGSSVWIDGSATMVKIVENTDTNSHAAYENPVGTFVDNTVYTFSTYLKAGERSWAKLGIKRKSSSISGAWFDLSGGLVGTIEAGTSTAEIEDCGNGIYRCSVSVDIGTGANAQQVFIYTATADNSLSYTGDGSSGLECYGLQFEEGSFATSLIPTSGATATRSADIADIATANFGYNSKAGTIVVEFRSSGFDPQTSSTLDFSDGTVNNRWSVRAAYAQSWHTSNISNGNLDYNDVGTDFAEVAYAISSSGQSASLNGGSVLFDDVTGMPTGITTLYIGTRFDGLSYYLNGHIKSIKYIPRRNSNTQLQEFTS